MKHEIVISSNIICYPIHLILAFFVFQSEPYGTHARNDVDLGKKAAVI